MVFAKFAVEGCPPFYLIPPVINVPLNSFLGKSLPPLMNWHAFLYIKKKKEPNSFLLSLPEHSELNESSVLVFTHCTCLLTFNLDCVNGFGFDDSCFAKRSKLTTLTARCRPCIFCLSHGLLHGIFF